MYVVLLFLFSTFYRLIWLAIVGFESRLITFIVFIYQTAIPKPLNLRISAESFEWPKRFERLAMDVLGSGPGTCRRIPKSHQGSYWYSVGSLCDWCGHLFLDRRFPWKCPTELSLPRQGGDGACYCEDSTGSWRCNPKALFLVWNFTPLSWPQDIWFCYRLFPSCRWMLCFNVILLRLQSRIWSLQLLRTLYR